MKKLKTFWLTLPRPLRTGCNLLAIALLGLVLYILLGCPAITPVQQFRRLEKAYLLGPSEILEIIEVDADLYDYLLVADDGDGVIFYDSFWHNDFGGINYRKKTGSLTVLPAPEMYAFQEWAHVLDLPVYLFDDYPQAVRGEMEVTLGEIVYEMEAPRTGDGYFRFTLHAGDPMGTELGEIGNAIADFSTLTDYTVAYVDDYVPVTVRLYDAQNTLVTEAQLTVRTAAGELAHNSQ